MKILHVSLADPAQHSGGLNRYCKELMEEQAKEHEVYILYPNNTNPLKKTKIIKKAPYKYELINALPVSITYGIKDTVRYMRPIDIHIFLEWFSDMKFDVIHIHSLQGIPKEFFEAANKYGCKMILTTHDYFGICLKATLLNTRGELCECGNGLKCAECNYNAGLSQTIQWLVNSKFYRYAQNNMFIKKIKGKFVKNYNESSKVNEKIEKKYLDVNGYERLLNYYRQILNKIDIIHCNSPITYDIYRKYAGNKKCVMIPISHKGIEKTSHVRKDEKYLNFTYMGGPFQHKGYKVFQNALLLLDKRGYKNWRAYLYGGEYTDMLEDERINYGGVFSKENAAFVWENTDVLVVPSQWYETFGFITLEGLSQGIPVIVSNIVGSNYLVRQIDASLVFDHDDLEELVKCMSMIFDAEYYKNLQKNIYEKICDIGFEKHANKVIDLYISQ